MGLTKNSQCVGLGLSHTIHICDLYRELKKWAPEAQSVISNLKMTLEPWEAEMLRTLSSCDGIGQSNNSTPVVSDTVIFTNITGLKQPPRHKILDLKSLGKVIKCLMLLCLNQISSK